MACRSNPNRVQSVSVAALNNDADAEREAVPGRDARPTMIASGGSRAPLLPRPAGHLPRSTDRRSGHPPHAGPSRAPRVCLPTRHGKPYCRSAPPMSPTPTGRPPASTPSADGAPSGSATSGFVPRLSGYEILVDWARGCHGRCLTRPSAPSWTAPAPYMILGGAMPGPSWWLGLPGEARAIAHLQAPEYRFSRSSISESPEACPYSELGVCSMVGQPDQMLRWHSLGRQPAAVLVELPGRRRRRVSPALYLSVATSLAISS